MDISPEVFVEMWNVLKPYVPQKERFDAAYSMIDFYDTNGDIEELRESDILDSYLAKALIGKKFKFVPASTNKVKRAEPFSAQVEAGNVKLVQGAWNQLFLDELNNFTGQSSEYHDDQVDAASGAFNMLSLKKPLPKLSFSDMSQRSKWK